MPSAVVPWTLATVKAIFSVRAEIKPVIPTLVINVVLEWVNVPTLPVPATPVRVTDNVANTLPICPVPDTLARGSSTSKVRLPTPPVADTLPVFSVILLCTVPKELVREGVTLSGSVISTSNASICMVRVSAVPPTPVRAMTGLTIPKLAAP